MSQPKLSPSATPSESAGTTGSVAAGSSAASVSPEGGQGGPSAVDRNLAAGTGVGAAIGGGTSRAASLTNHRLPTGMRDLLQEDARHERQVAAQISREFFLHGYEEVKLPVFEYLDVVSRGLGKVDPQLLVRFVEPETGEVVALRPDMTPQVARLVASHWPLAPRPMRLSYHGSVLRRRPERARNDLQVLQAGIELVGATGAAADVEVMTTCLGALRAVGLGKFVVDVGHGTIASALLAGLEEEAERQLLRHLAHKDQVEVERAVATLGLDSERARAIVSLPELQGGPEVLSRAKAMTGFDVAGAQLEELGLLLGALERAGYGDQVVIDLGETKSTPYYTGFMFQVLAEGPGQAVASGGRYDSLYSKFGIERAAAGAAINIDHLRWALGGPSSSVATRVLLVSSGNPSQDARANDAASEGEGGGPVTDVELQKAAHSLRRAGYAAVVYPERTPLENAHEYARLANFSHVVEMMPAGQIRGFAVGGAAPAQLSVRSIEDLLALLPGSV